MNKTININLGGYFFHIDESAYQKLRRYLDAIARSLSEDPQGKNEIIADIEARISELLSKKITDARQVVNEQDISDIIKIMGEPEDYADGEEGYTDTRHQYARRSSNSKKLFRDGDDKFLGGVASGIGHYFGVDVIWIRLAFIVLLISVFSILLYIILWILLPEAKTTAEKLQMEGEAVNINNIEKKIREEFTNVKESIKKGAENISEKFSNAEKKYKPKAKSGFQDFLDTLGNILTLFFKIIGKFIGVILVIISASFLIGSIFGIFSVGSFGILGLNDFTELSLFMNSSSLPGWLLVICFIILVGFPFLILFILGLRILSSNVKKIGKTASLTLFGIWIIALFMTIFAGIEFGASHARSGSSITKEKLALQAQDSITIEVVNDDQIYYQRNRFSSIDNREEVFIDGKRAWYSNYLKVDVSKSKKEDSYVEIRKRSRGKNVGKAQENASKIKFKYEVKGNRILIDGYFLINFSNFGKDEVVFITLYVKEGVTVYFDESSSGFLNNVDNTTDIYDRDMVNHHFLMTEKGLDCTDCKEEIIKEQADKKGTIAIDINNQIQ